MKKTGVFERWRQKCGGVLSANQSGANSKHRKAECAHKWRAEPTFYNFILLPKFTNNIHLHSILFYISEQYQYLFPTPQTTDS
jgi:hypothetical protein